MRTRAIIWLVVNLIVLGLLGIQARDGLHFETDILKLLPKTEQNPRAERAVRTFSETMGNRVVFLIGHDEAAHAREAARMFSALLNESELFTAVNAEMQSNDQKDFYTLYFPHRAALISTEQAQALTTEEGVEEHLSASMQLLYSPMASSLSPLLADDPLLLFPQWIKGLPQPPGKSEVNEGFLQVEEKGKTYVVVEGQATRSPFSRAHQAPAIAVIDSAIAVVQQEVPGVVFEKTGVLFFAHAGAQSAEGEIRVIGLGSMLGVILLILFVFRSPRRLVISLLPIASGFLFALTASLYLFPDLHLITLGFGASLIGVCVDYSFHYFADTLGKKDPVDGPAVLRRILPGISLGMMTSVLAYMGLFIAPFPGLRQMAVFSSVGLLGAFGTVVAWYPPLLHGQRLSHNPSALFQTCNLVLALWRWLHKHKAAAIVLMLASLYIASGIAKLEANDDVRQLQSPSPELIAAEQHIRSLMGNVDLSRFLLVEAATPEAVLQKEEHLVPRLEAMQADGALEFFQSISQWVPSAQTQRARRDALRTSLVKHADWYQAYFNDLGFDTSTYTNLLKQLESPSDLLTLDSWSHHDASKHFRHLWLGEVEGAYASLILLGGLHDFDAFAELEGDVDGVTFVNKVDDVSALFARYRKLAGWLVVGSYLVIGLFLFLRYGLRRAALVFLPPCIAATLTLGVLGHFAQPITLFNGLALLLVLGIGIDYTIFFAEARSNTSHVMLAIMLSAFTTLLSFGLLALSQTQALSRFGLTLLIGILLALFFAPMAAGTRSPSTSEHES